MSDEEMAQETETAVKRACGLVVDFDYTIVDGIGILEKVFTKALSAAGVSMTPSLFVRSLFGSKAVSAVTTLLGTGSAVTPEAVLSALPAAMDKAVENAAVNTTVMDICKHTIDQGIKVLFVTSRSLAIVEQKLESAGIPGAQLLKVDRSDRIGEYSPEIWAKAARTIRLSPRHCTVIAASATSIRQAVVVGMRTAAFPNPLINFEDFSGADLIAEGMNRDTAFTSVVNLIWHDDE